MRARKSRWRWSAAVLAASGVLAPMTAALASPEAWHAHAESVLELLQADTRRALDRTAGQTPAPVAAPDTLTQAKRAQDRLELAALYGTAGKFTAVVYVNGVRKEYRPGATLPFAGNGAASEYRLVRIVDNCVLLRKHNAGRTRSACFSPALPQDATPVRSDSPALAASGAAALSSPLPAPARP